MATYTINDRKKRLARIESWLYMPADSFGECDECHADHVALWDDIDTEGAGDWQYCRSCWQRRIATLKDRIKRHREEIERTPSTSQPVMFSGLDCLPGQTDLFPTDGSL